MDQTESYIIRDLRDIRPDIDCAFSLPWLNEGHTKIPNALVVRELCV